ncbi:MAG: lipopolysaccharide kinase InaA family protein [Desulfurivibrio sp.]|nr:lipopolysaccharide kinase InaA family protein [Desulfurivibrio sp.]
MDKFQILPEAAQTLLSGRMCPHVVEIEGYGKVVIKHYYRGGILRHGNRRTYLKIGRIRCCHEFNILTQVRNIGVNAPQPIAFASRTKGLIFYHAWLVTKQIPGVQTIADISRKEPGRAEAVLPEVASQFNKLICHGILHVDLHPGMFWLMRWDGVYGGFR